MTGMIQARSGPLSDAVDPLLVLFILLKHLRVEQPDVRLLILGLGFVGHEVPGVQGLLGSLP